MEEISNYNILKKIEVEELLGFLGPFDFITTPWRHQVAPFIASIMNDGFLLFLDLGAGKTKIAIDACRYFEKLNGGLTIWVICPKSAVGKWGDEVYKHSGMKYNLLQGTPAQKIKKIDKAERGFYIIGWDSFRTLLSTKIKLKGKKKNKFVPDPAKIRYIKKTLGKVDIVIADESHNAKNPRSLNFKALREFTAGVKKNYLLTGTPFDKNLIDIWAQYFIADRGATYGKRFTRDFRDLYFEDKGYFGPLWKVTEYGRKEIEKKLYSLAMRYAEEEIEGLPPKNFEVVKFTLTTKQQKLYDLIVKDPEVLNIKNKSHALRQICSGVYRKTKEIFTANPKRDALADLIDSLDEEKKFVIYYYYVLEFEVLKRLMKKMKIDFCFLNGSQKDPDSQVRDFQKKKKHRAMIAQYQSGRESIDLFAANYCFFFSMHPSVIYRKQAVKRIHRGGQKLPCFYFDFTAEDSLEVAHLKSINKGIDLFDTIVDTKTFAKAVKGEV